jgi:hypothetical protein
MSAPPWRLAARIIGVKALRRSAPLGLALAMAGCGSSGESGAGGHDGGIDAAADAAGSTPGTGASPEDGAATMADEGAPLVDAGPDPCASDGGGQPITLATDPEGPADLQVFGTYVYWSNGSGQIERVPVCGGSVETLGTADKDSVPALLAVDSTQVYFTNESSVGVLGGSAPSTLSLVPPAQASVAIGLSAGFLYVGTAPTAAAGTVGPNSGTVDRAPVSGGGSMELQTSVADPLGHFVFDATDVYWMDYMNAISRMPLGGGAITTLVPGQSSAVTYALAGLAVDGANVYWSEGPATGTSRPTKPTTTSSSVNRMPLAMGAVVTLASGYQFAGLAADAVSAYWLDTYKQEVESVALAGGPVQVLVSSEPAAIGPIVDDHAIYWATTDGRIRRMSKASP